MTAEINGVMKSFKAYVQDGIVKSVNMYPGVSSRATSGTIIDLGKMTW